MTDPTQPTVTTQQADFILFNRLSLRLLAAGIMPRTSASVVEMAVSGGGYAKSQVELAAIERATLTQVVGGTEDSGEVAKALKAHVAGWPLDRRLAFECAVHLKYDKNLTWRKVSRKAHYSSKQCQRFCDEARKAVAARLSELPGTAMEDFWKTVGRLGRLAEESRANERRARSEESGADERDEGEGKASGTRAARVGGVGKADKSRKGKRGGRG